MGLVPPAQETINKYIDIEIDFLIRYIYRNHRFLNDEELAALYHLIPFRFDCDYNMPRLNRIISKRAKWYCIKNNIEYSNYPGPLPFRHFSIDARRIFRIDVAQVPENQITQYINDMRNRLQNVPQDVVLPSGITVGLVSNTEIRTNFDRLPDL